MAIFAQCWVSRNVPDDVWRLVFWELSNSYGGLPTSIKSIKMAINLTHVCPQFRRVAVHQPELWNKIPIIIVLDDLGALFPDEDVVILALRRASELPLTLNLRVDSRSIERGAAVCHGFTGVATFLECIHRAKVLSIDHTAIRVCGQYNTLINALCAQGAPVLEELLYYGSESEIMGSIGMVISEFSKKSTRLKTLKIFREQGIYVDWRRFQFSFNQLVDLEIGGPITSQALVAVLSSSKFLSTCVIHEIWDYEKPDRSSRNGVISLPFLVKLHIRGSRPIAYDPVSQILSSIVAPSLETLSLSEFGWHPSYTLNFVRTSRFILQYLSFEGVVISSTEVLSFLEFLPSLQLLALDTFPSRDDNIAFSRQMTACNPVTQKFQLCPVLRVLIIFYTCLCKDDDFQSTTLLSESVEGATPISEMVEKRLRGHEGGPSDMEVRIIQINPCRLSAPLEKSSFGEIARLLALKGDGLNIALELGRL